MKRVFAVLSVLAVIAFSAAAFADMKDSVQFNGGPMGKVSFDHKKHSGTMECQKCHHGQEAGKEQSCSKCHTKTSGKTNKEAFHKSCQGCHKESGKGPVKCGECHKK